MKLKEYAKKINELAKENGNLEVAYAIDDEGNGFRYVNYSPCVGKVVINGDEVKVVTIN